MIQPSSDRSSRRRASLARRLFCAEFLIPALALVVLAMVSTPHLTRASDARQDSLARSTAAIHDAIARYRERTSGQYDPVNDGWAPLVDAGYLPAAPTNPVTGSSLVTRRPAATSGWTYSALDGTLGACVVDAETNEVRLLHAVR